MNFVLDTYSPEKTIELYDMLYQKTNMDFQDHHVDALYMWYPKCLPNQILLWLHNKNLLTQRHIDMFCGHGTIDTLKFITSLGYTFSGKAYKWAIIKNDMEFLDYVKNHNNQSIEIQRARLFNMDFLHIDEKLTISKVWIVLKFHPNAITKMSEEDFIIEYKKLRITEFDDVDEALEIFRALMAMRKVF
jgi:hypothetical protein